MMYYITFEDIYEQFSEGALKKNHQSEHCLVLMTSALHHAYPSITFQSGAEREVGAWLIHHLDSSASDNQ